VRRDRPGAASLRAAESGELEGLKSLSPKALRYLNKGLAQKAPQFAQ
jgi:hypothetical protein